MNLKRFPRYPLTDVRLGAAGFDIGIHPSWEQAMDDVRKAGGNPSRFRPAVRSTRTVDSALSASPKKCGRRRPKWVWVSTTSWSAR